MADSDSPFFCNYTWSAPMKVHDRDQDVSWVPHKCTLRANHLDDHIGWARVTAANKKGE